MIDIHTWVDPGRSKALGQMIDAGMSAGEIAARMQLSRNAVIGRAHRLGWSFGRARTPEERARESLPGRKFKPRVRTAPEDRMVELTIRLDPETLREVAAIAAQQQRSKASVYRDLIEWGLEAARQEGADY